MDANPHPLLLFRSDAQNAMPGIVPSLRIHIRVSLRDIRFPFTLCQPRDKYLRLPFALCQTRDEYLVTPGTASYSISKALPSQW